jgi:superfamily II DNA or RNA helicase
VSQAAHLPPAFPGRAAWGTATKLRAWQAQALDLYLARQPRDFLAVATPGSGKTTFALRVAGEMLERRIVERVVVVTPTEHLKSQWAAAAERAGIPLDPAFTGRNAKLSGDYRGFVLTYAGVAAAALAYRVRVERFKTLVILDEVHHAGDALSWGEATREAFEPATRRLLLTGTPFRSDANPIPFVTYAPGQDGVSHSAADYSYGYEHGLRDGVVRPVLFHAYSGDLRWRTRAGDEVEARLGEPLTRDLTASALRTALDPAGSWMPSVLSAANTRLTQVRRHVPDAAGLVIASDQDSARAYARLLQSVSGERPVLVLSDERTASRRIAAFTDSADRWMVAVRMVSEGVDVPRLAVGVYATTTATPLFFAQAVGRFVRARRRGETASVFLPSVAGLLGLASTMEVQRDHVLGRRVDDEASPFAAEDDLLARAEQTQTTPDLESGPFQALSSDASFDRVLFDGGEFGHEGAVAVGSDEEMDYLGIPGLLEPGQMHALLRARRETRVQRGSATAGSAKVAQTTHEELRALRRELNGLVGAWFHRTGTPHGVTHVRLRDECGGPPAAQADAEQLRARIDALRHEAARPTRRV